MQIENRNGRYYADGQRVIHKVVYQARKPVGIVCAIYEENENKIYLGYSKWWKGRDKWNKIRGLEIAIERARLYTDIRWNSSDLPHCVRPYLKYVDKVARKYWEKSLQPPDSWLSRLLRKVRTMARKLTI